MEEESVYKNFSSGSSANGDGWYKFACGLIYTHVSLYDYFYEQLKESIGDGQGCELNQTWMIMSKKWDTIRSDDYTAFKSNI